MPEPKPPSLRRPTNHERLMDTLRERFLSLLEQPAIRAGLEVGKQIDEGFRGQMGQEDSPWAGPKEGQRVAATVFHGSPHLFRKFDASKIGTGEGPQAYGHGLYFADNPKVAKEYWDKLADPEVRILGQTQPIPSWSAGLSPQPWTMRALADARAVNPTATEAEIIEHVKKRIIPDLHSTDAARANAAQSKLDILQAASERNLQTVKPGGIYDVDLPDEAIAKMLDWDAPLSQQPEAAKAAIKQRGIDPDNPAFSNWRGSEYYMGETNVMHPPGVSRELNRLGIPGIKYLDGMSRGAGQGSRNYVVFDDSLPKILKINGMDPDEAIRQALLGRMVK